MDNLPKTTDLKIKILLIGQEKVGKTTYVSRLTDPDFILSESYKSTNGVEIKTINLCTNMDNLQIDIWDITGNEKLCGLRDGYYINADAAILMYNSKTQIGDDFKELNRICNDIPIVLLKNKNTNIKLLKSEYSWNIVNRLINNSNGKINAYSIDIIKNDINKLIQPILLLCQKLFDNKLIFE